MLILLGALVTACGRSTSTGSGNDALVHVKLPLGYIPNIQFAPLYVAVEKGYFKDAGIEIEFDYSQETDAVALVGADDLQFAVVSGEQVLLARAQGLPVTYVAAWYQQYPVAVVSKVDQNIKTPADLKNKKIGLPGLYGANYIGLEALLFSAGLTDKDVTNEPIQLRAQGYDLNEIRVADYLQLASNGLITNEKTIADNPDLVRRMAKALLQGLADTIANPDEAYTLSKAHIPNLTDADATVQKEVLARSIDLWKADRLGFSNTQAWQNMQDTLLKMSLLKEPLNLEKAFTNDFVP